MMVYQLSVEDKPFSATDEALLTWVSPHRRDKVLRYRFPIDGRLSLYGALLVRMGICIMTGKTNNQLAFSEGDKGKPCFLGDDHLSFSLTHTRNMAACCLSQDGSVGIDTERLRPISPEVMPMVFHDREIQYVKCGDDAPLKNSRLSDSQPARFFTIWTRKEALGKALGKGLLDDLTGYDLIHGPLDPSCYTWESDGYITSLCLQKTTAADKTPLGRDSFAIRSLTEKDICAFFLSQQE